MANFGMSDPGLRLAFSRERASGAFLSQQRAFPECLKSSAIPPTSSFHHNLDLNFLLNAQVTVRCESQQSRIQSRPQPPYRPIGDLYPLTYPTPSQQLLLVGAPSRPAAVASTCCSEAVTPRHAYVTTTKPSQHRITESVSGRQSCRCCFYSSAPISCVA